MELKELFLYRQQMLDDCRDADGYISDAGFLESCLPLLNETKHTDSTDVTIVYDSLENGTIKVNGYMVNESGERLQVFLVSEDSLNPQESENELMIGQKAVYEKSFNRALTFIKKSIKKQMNELLQDGSSSWILAHLLGDSDFLEQIDVIEIFLLSATATIESRGSEPSAKMVDFDNDSININYTLNNTKQNKDIIIMKRLIDLNFLYNVHIAQGSRYPLKIDFTESPFNYPIPFLTAATEPDFDSYLCAFSGSLLADLYKHYSSRLLEKNVRSFLQLRGVNKGMQDTIKKEPSRFIAYNNGITITATSKEIINKGSDSYIKSLSDFQIVNGGQTTATLYFSKKMGLNIDEIRVMAKINVVKDADEEVLDELISNISTFSNAQSKVSKVDLRARSPQLVKLKALSESVLTVSSKKWFFERAKGEYATMMRINASKKSQLEKTFPKERRFSKEELAKYYSAWGEIPYAVKRGGEKIFRLFLEEISGEGKVKKPVNINRAFYEDLISRIILFRGLEKIYGAGNNSLGQLRSAVVPYSLAVLYCFTTGNKKANAFDLSKIWKAEKLEDDLQAFFRKLMKQMNDWIKKYTKGEDYGEFSKKQETWDAIKDSKEVTDFMSENFHRLLVNKYTISREELKSREKESVNVEVVDFEPLSYAGQMFDRGIEFYRSVLQLHSENFSDSQIIKINGIIAAIAHVKMLEKKYIDFDKELIRILTKKDFDLLKKDNNSQTYSSTINFIIKKYNSAITNSKDIEASFQAVKELARRKGVKFYSVFGDIGECLKNSELPTMRQVKEASEYIKTLEIVLA